MTDPSNNAPQDQTPPSPPARPAYGEYAPSAPTAPAAPSAPAAPAYEQAAYAPAPPAAPGAPGAGTSAPGKTLGIVAFVLSFFIQFIALILGIIALVQSKKAGRPNGFALAAIIISSILLVIGIVLLAIFVPLLVASISAANTCLEDPTGFVTIAGATLSCEEVLGQSGR